MNLRLVVKKEKEKKSTFKFRFIRSDQLLNLLLKKKRMTDIWRFAFKL